MSRSGEPVNLRTNEPVNPNPRTREPGFGAVILSRAFHLCFLRVQPRRPS